MSTSGRAEEAAPASRSHTGGTHSRAADSHVESPWCICSDLCQDICDSLVRILGESGNLKGKRGGGGGRKKREERKEKKEKRRKKREENSGCYKIIIMFYSFKVSPS